jgi:predicted nucleic acid-binding protein
VVQEFLNTCLRKARLGRNREALRDSLDILLAGSCHMPSADTVRRAFDIQHRFQIAYWDAAIIAAAQELGCDTLYTEDLNQQFLKAIVTACSKNTRLPKGDACEMTMA